MTLLHLTLSDPFWPPELVVTAAQSLWGLQDSDQAVTLE